MLITSISGIRGTLGGDVGESLTPIDIVNFAGAYANFLKKKFNDMDSILVIIGRDGRQSGQMIESLFTETLIASGINVISLGLVPTPTLELQVPKHNAQGGIIITASHNPKEYNGIKMLNDLGEFLSNDDGEELLNLIQHQDFSFVEVDDFGSYLEYDRAIHDHVQAILELEIIDTDRIRSKKFTVVTDTINSVGALILPELFARLDIVYIPLFDAIHGDFAHTPEPLEQNLGVLKDKVRETGADFGVAVDPDVDRLVLVDENGNMFGEEYSQVICADTVLADTPGNIVTNLSSSKAMDDIAQKYQVECLRTAVGEKNVVDGMKKVQAVFGGEGSGGVIYPELHYGRDAVVGIALVLQKLTDSNMKLSEVKESYTRYHMAKSKVSTGTIPASDIVNTMIDIYRDADIDTQDGLKINFPDSWVHLRKSNTEPIIRVYTEAKEQSQADALAQDMVNEISGIIDKH